MVTYMSVQRSICANDLRRTAQAEYEQLHIGSQ
jgi:hypothetical protein